MATYVMSDIHGEYEKFLKMLEVIDFKDEDTLYILGDIFDRGSNPIDVFEYIKDKKNIKLILGNHEDMFMNAHETYDYREWFANGGYTTYLQMLEQENPYYMEIVYNYLKNKPLYEVVKVNNINFILVHAHIVVPTNYQEYTIEEILKMQERKTLLWERNAILKRQFEDNENIIVFGHTPVNFLTQLPAKDNEVMAYYDKIAIDCGAYFEGKLACIRLEDLTDYYVA